MIHVKLVPTMIPDQVTVQVPDANTGTGVEFLDSAVGPLSPGQVFSPGLPPVGIVPLLEFSTERSSPNASPLRFIHLGYSP